MRTIVIYDTTNPTVAQYTTGSVPDEFADVIEWLVRERLEYQPNKWDYAGTDGAHVAEGLGDDSWFWNKGILNYTGRVRLFDEFAPEGARWFHNPLAVQALLKLAATLVCMPEHLLRTRLITELPLPGHPSGQLQ